MHDIKTVFNDGTSINLSETKVMVLDVIDVEAYAGNSYELPGEVILNSLKVEFFISQVPIPLDGGSKYPLITDVRKSGNHVVWNRGGWPLLSTVRPILTICVFS